MPKTLKKTSEQPLPLLRRDEKVVSEVEVIDIMTDPLEESRPTAELRPAKPKTKTNNLKNTETKSSYFSLLSKTKDFVLNSQFVALISEQQMKLPKLSKANPKAYRNLQKAIHMLQSQHLIFAQRQKIKELHDKVRVLETRVKTIPVSNPSDSTNPLLTPAFTMNTNGNSASSETPETTKTPSKKFRLLGQRK